METSDKDLLLPALVTSLYVIIVSGLFSIGIRFGFVLEAKRVSIVFFSLFVDEVSIFSKIFSHSFNSFCAYSHITRYKWRANIILTIAYFVFFQN